MSVVCNVSVAEAKAYRGVSIKAKYNGKKQQVLLRLLCDETNVKEAVDLARVSKNVAMLEYQGNDEYKALSLMRNTGVYIGRVFNCGNNIDESELERLVDDVPQCVTPIIYFPDDFSDLELVWKLAQKFPNVRFCGGKLFAIEGIKIGAVGLDTLDKAGIKYEEESYIIDGTMDVIDSVSFSDLSEIETSAKAEVKQKSVGLKKPQISFASIMASGGTVEP